MFAPVGVLAACAAAVTLVHVRDPGVDGHYPACPFLSVTGYYCPGCGSLRAIHALSNGDPITALSRNPLTVVMAVVLAVIVALWARWEWRGGGRIWVAPPWMLWGFLGVVLLFWVLRNMPGMTWLSPV
ncbi:MAG: DUF2752 domain-containing protein [Nostocoides sp.]